MIAVTGIVALISFVALVIKYPLRKLGYHKANAKLMELHEAASAVVFVIGIVHGCLALGRSRRSGRGCRNGRNCRSGRGFRIASGLSFFTIFTVLIAACHMTEDPEKKMKDHRVLSLASSVALLEHLVK